MEKFLSELSGGEAVDDVFDLCLDYDLVRDQLEEPFQSLGGLEGFHGLEQLSIARHQIHSFAGLPAFPHLQQLNLSQNELENGSDFPPLPQLRLLDLGLNQLETVAGLPELPALEEFHLSYNDLSGLEQFPPLPRLRSLFINGNRRLRSLVGTEYLGALAHLTAWNTRITDWAALAAWHQLQSLRTTPVTPALFPVLEQQGSIQQLEIDLKWYAGSVQWPKLPQLTDLKLKPGSVALSGWGHLSSLQRLTVEKGHWNELPEAFVEMENLQEVSFSELPLNGYGPLLKLEKLRKVVLGKGAIHVAGIREIESQRPEIEVVFA